MLLVVPVWSLLSILLCMLDTMAGLGALMALTEHGTVHARSFKRLPESDRFVASKLEKLKGLPWNLLASLDAERLDRPLIAGPDAMGIPILPVPASMPPLPSKAQERRMYVTSADVRKYGGSGGCQACAQVYICGKTNVPHSDACRRRIQELMKGDDAGRARLDASRKRKASSHAFERDAPLMPGVRQELAPGDRFPRQEESTRHGGGDVEIPAAHGSGDPDQSMTHASWSGGAASSSDQGLKRTAGQAGLPEDEDISHSQGTKRTALESTGSGLEPDARRQRGAGRTDSTMRNDADFDIQVTKVDMSSSDDPSSGSNSIASMCWRGEQHVRRDQVVDAFRNDRIDIGEKEAQEISSLLLEIGSVTSDGENPQRAVVSQCEKLGLRPGFVVDLNALKSWNGTAWSLCTPKGGDELMDFLDKEDPVLVIGSSSYDVSDFLKGSNCALKNQTNFHACARAYARQHQKGKVFLHEAPIGSISWKDRDISRIASSPDVFKVKGPICRWSVCKEDVSSAGFDRQAIGWMTNDEQLARALASQCGNCEYGSGEWTREVSSSGGLGRNGAVFPPRLISSVLKVIKRKVLDRRVVSAVELESGGPTAELPEIWNQPDYKEYWDDVNGGFLDPHLVREARLLELILDQEGKSVRLSSQGRGREEGYRAHSSDMGGH